MPAQLTRTSTPPQRVPSAETTRSQSPARVTSRCSPTTSNPSPRNEAARLLEQVVLDIGEHDLVRRRERAHRRSPVRCPVRPRLPVRSLARRPRCRSPSPSPRDFRQIVDRIRLDVRCIITILEESCVESPFTADKKSRLHGRRGTRRCRFRARLINQSKIYEGVLARAFGCGLPVRDGRLDSESAGAT